MPQSLRKTIEHINREASEELSAYDSTLSGSSESDLDPEQAATTLYMAMNTDMPMTTYMSQPVETCMDALSYSRKELEKLEALYQLDRVKQGADSEITEEVVSALFESNYQDALLLEKMIGFYLVKNDLEQALTVSQALIDADDAIENYIIYTDVLAQAAQSGVLQDTNSDKQIERKIAEKESQWQAAMPNSEARAEIEMEIEALNAESQELPIRQAINYFISKKPLFEDRSGIYDLQLAKLYFAIDDRATSKQYIDEVIENVSKIDEASPIKEPLTVAATAYEDATFETFPDVFYESLDEAVTIQSQNIVAAGSDTLNETFSDYMAAALKYDKMALYISRIDTSKYPEIRADFSISGERATFLNLFSEFSEKDFDLQDTGYDIGAFKLSKLNDTTRTEIILVLDESGSMDGAPIEESKRAATAFIEDIESNEADVAVVSYSDLAIVRGTQSDSKITLSKNIADIHIGFFAGTNISAGLQAAIDLANPGANTVIILMSDGQDGGEKEAMNTALNRAVNAGIKIYTVGLGDVDGDYMGRIASATGGKYVHTLSSVELEFAYDMMKNYIFNRYQIQYEVSQNVAEDPRQMTLEFAEGALKTTRPYTIGQMSESIDYMADVPFEMTSLTPSAVSDNQTAEPIEIEIKGTGFEVGMIATIGGSVLEGMRFVDETTLRGTLNQPLPPGTYDVEILSPNGGRQLKTNIFSVYKPSGMTKVKLGNNIISANVIGQTAEDTLIATGNVMLNGFLHTNGDMQIEAKEILSYKEMMASSIIDLGDSGVLSGTGNLFVSYEKISDNGFGSSVFAKVMLGGKNYTVSKSGYEIHVMDGVSDFDGHNTNFGLQIPMIANIDIGKATLYSDRIEIEVNYVQPETLLGNLNDSISKNRTTTSDEARLGDHEKGRTSDLSDFQFDAKNTEIKTKMTVTGDDLIFSFDVTLAGDQMINLGHFLLEEVSLKLDSRDEAFEYWRIGAAFNFGGMVKTLTGLEGEIGAYYWCPDEIAITVALSEGIPIYDVVFIDKLGLKISGLSSIILDTGNVSSEFRTLLLGNPDHYEAKDLILGGMAHAEVNLFKALKLRLPKEMMEMADLGEIDNASFELNLSDHMFSISADLKILKQKLAHAGIRFGSKGLDLEGQGKLELAIFDVLASGEMNCGYGINTEKLYFNFDVNGRVDSGFLDYHVYGRTAIEMLAELDGGYYSVAISNAQSKIKCWYDDTSSPLIWERFNVEVFEL